VKKEKQNALSIPPFLPENSTTKETHRRQTNAEAVFLD
jgi:hypothetical protein